MLKNHCKIYTKKSDDQQLVFHVYPQEGDILFSKVPFLASVAQD